MQLPARRHYEVRRTVVGGRGSALVLALFALASAKLDAQQGPAGVPVWVTLGEAEQAIEQNEYGEALSLLREALSAGGASPEIDFALGRIYEATGDLDLASRHYGEALAKQAEFAVEGSAYEVRYRWAALYERRSAFFEFERQLRMIIADDERFSGPGASRLRENFRRVITVEGINRFLELYREPMSFSFEAHRRLARFYVQSGRFDDGLIHSLFALTQLVTELVDGLIRFDPAYEFESMEALYADISVREDLARLSEQAGLSELLYHLGNSLYGSTREGRARSIWRLVVELDADRRFAGLAAAQLRDPQVEQTIVPDRF